MRKLIVLAVAVLLCLAVRQSSAQCVPSEPTGGSQSTLAPSDDDGLGAVQMHQPAFWLSVQTIRLISKLPVFFGVKSVQAVRSLPAASVAIGKRRG